MSTLMDEEIKRWTAKRKTTLVLEIIQGKTSVLEASRNRSGPANLNRRDKADSRQAAGPIEGWREGVLR